MIKGRLSLGDEGDACLSKKAGLKNALFLAIIEIFLYFCSSNPYGGQKHIRMNEKKLVNMVLALTCLLLSPTLLACSSNDEDEPKEKSNFTFIDNLPEAENVRSTSAYIPVNDKGSFCLRYSTSEDISSSFMYVSSLNTLLEKDSCGFYLSGLEPETTYYYTMVCVTGNEEIPSNQVKSFTTKGVVIEFVEPETVSMGNWSRKIPRVKTNGIEDRDIHSLFVQFRIWPVSAPSDKGLSNVTTFAGNGIWKDDNSLEEGYCYQASVTNSYGRIFAQTPVMLWTNGTMLELHEK